MKRSVELVGHSLVLAVRTVVNCLVCLSHVAAVVICELRLVTNTGTCSAMLRFGSLVKMHCVFSGLVKFCCVAIRFAS